MVLTLYSSSNLLSVRMGVIIGGLIQASVGDLADDDQVQTEEQEFIENLPGFLNIGICTLFVSQG